MNTDNLHTFSFCILSLIIITSKICHGADYRYEACAPANCGNGPNISYPFFLPSQQRQQSYCGFPVFAVNCSSSGFPLLRLSENEYIIEDIFYHNQSIHVVDAAVQSSSNCTIYSSRNTTLPAGKLNYVGGEDFLLFSGCGNVTGELLRYQVACHSSATVTEAGGSRAPASTNTPSVTITNSSSTGITISSVTNSLAMYGGNGNLGRAVGTCVASVAVHAELNEDERGEEVVDVAAVLGRGFVMNWTAASDCSACQESGGRCGFDENSDRFRCFCRDRPHSTSCGPGETILNMLLYIGGPIAALTFCLIVAYVFIRRKRAKAKQAQEKDIKHFLEKNGNLAPIRYKYSTIKKITNSFNETLGKGGFGNVYKGKLPNSRLVAIKVLNDSNGNGEDFMNEVASISRTSHVNIVPLLGFCFEGSERALIYDFMPNGSLEKFIGNNASSSQESALGWDKLFEIALGIARGLEYLHQGCNTRILHLDIKPQNILLDEDMNPRISDFGLAKLCPNRSGIVSMKGTRGTIGYIAPEVFYRNFGEVSYKSDVYSYGMLVLEMAGGKKTIDRRDVDRTSETYFPNYIYKELEVNAERAMNEEAEAESQPLKRNMIIVGLWCIQTNPKDRPSMTRVVEMLEGKLGSLEVPPKPYLQPSPRAAPTYSTSESSSLLR
ncbi:LEAF RUST 10 DISEASE-RESISTANCE LOCUS RECEPTOR-LIKE PROTEIN KINASE-like 2.1 [Salvia splendens]|uniref:LEAF RUST 10 DISEASE-RESISTANCE LOCUS RECEPTOR-LIKE PROTEIN KINASE-like 2.1 n=1 Tax=Salvia splendens TaxID=180675 RepID=UPI001C277BEE|nr:LEAF RUST 10 DISEASE-RESISTANCE LOCUS RECEPTOR-LIKE PROTEIN KINASE-like 2.1 [Salvia splendens]